MQLHRESTWHKTAWKEQAWSLFYVKKLKNEKKNKLFQGLCFYSTVLCISAAVEADVNQYFTGSQLV